MKTIARFVVMFFLVAFAQNLQAQGFDGFYFGGYLGGAFAHSHVTTTVFLGNSIPGPGYLSFADAFAIAAAGDKSLSPSGLSAGGQAGYNFQRENFVFGIEADYGAMPLKKEAAETANYPSPYEQFTFTVTQRVRTRWLFTARPRVGYAAGNLLVFGTAGVAVTDIDYLGTFSDDYASARESGTVSRNKTGWVAGAGAEYRISRFSIKAEYLHTKFRDFGTESFNLTVGTPGVAVPENRFEHSVNLSSNIVRGGVNFYF